MLHFLTAASIGAPVASLARDIVLTPVSRRAALFGGAAFALAAHVRPAAAFEPYAVGGSSMPHGLVTDPLVFVAIEPDGTVIITAHRAEMGQGARTSLPMIVADEMEADWARVRIVQAPGDEPRYGNQDTDGSRSLRHHLQSMRQIGASVRHMLASAAAKTWGVEPGAVAVGNHRVTGPDGRSADFGELAEAAMAEPTPAFEALTFKTEDQFRYIGKGVVQIADLRDITTGAATYGADVTLDGMLTAVIARPPVLGSRVKRFDAAAALAIPGVEQVVELQGVAPPVKFAPLGGVAVLATNTWAAMMGRDALEIEWEDSPHDAYDSDAFRAEMEATAQAPGRPMRTQGDVEAAFASAARTFERTYHQAHMAHAAMEPPVATARFADGRLELWAPVQSPFGARQDVAADLGLDIADVTVNVTLLGGGFGRKSKCDYAIEAARLARATGRPVRVQWTREDDIRHSFMHTTSVERIAVALDANDGVTAWRHNSVAPSILSTFAPDSGHQFPIETGMGHVDMPFDIPNVLCENGAAMAHARIGWYRAVSNVPRAFAVQSFAAELAHELGRDQKDFLLELIGEPRVIDPKAAGMPEDLWNYGEDYATYPIDTGRLAHVLELAAEKAGWGRDLPEGEGLGLAVHRSFVSYVAVAARVRIDGGLIRVPEMHFAIDCGFAANPERIESQLQGAAVMGMTLTLDSAVTFRRGAVEQSNFHDYQMVKVSNYPEAVSVHIVPHPIAVPASGVGEPGVPPVAPAILNAVFNASGKRLRSLPTGASV